ncbi:MAG: hypothetical protein RMK29_05595 [Myxococcales bacterium]|nr:hypothetical protein [Myxococcota bacterium]MDW8281164.1 hypothetical protein [Myxococcales bacterium]
MRVRIVWSPASQPLRIEEISLSGQMLLSEIERTGGMLEVSLSGSLPPRPLLRWRLRGSRVPGPSLIDEIRIELRDAWGQWHLVGELLGRGQPWRGERLVGSLLRGPSSERLMPGWNPV